MVDLVLLQYYWGYAENQRNNHRVSQAYQGILGGIGVLSMGFQWAESIATPAIDVYAILFSYRLIIVILVNILPMAKAMALDLIRMRP